MHLPANPGYSAGDAGRREPEVRPGEALPPSLPRSKCGWRRGVFVR